MTATSALPTGFAVRLRSDLAWRDGGQLLVGGSPLRALRLSPTARDLVDADVVRVQDAVSAELARRLLDANVADPVLPTEAISPADLTVVIPVRDRTEQLERCLAALAPLRCVVVDDDSLASDELRAVADRHGARTVRLVTNVGPAAARNAGLQVVATSYVAFVDSDVSVEAATLLALAVHFADPRVSLVGPRVRGLARSPRPRWFERYDEQAPSLGLGTRACSVRPGAAVAWLPSACLVGRVAALGDGFDPTMRIGEDVDLVWRLVGAGHVVRYDPRHEAFHDVRPTIRGWLGRKLVYGTGGADLARRHGRLTAPAVLSPTMALTGAALLVRRRWSVPVALAGVAWGARSVRRALPTTERPDALAWRLSIRGAGWAVRQESNLLLRHWWPPTLLAMVLSRTVRRAVTSALIVDTALSMLEGRGVEPVPALFARRLDDLSYGAGLWLGALRARSWRCLAVRGPRLGPN